MKELTGNKRLFALAGILGIAVAIVGLTVALGWDQRALGVTIFKLGFFIAALSGAGFSLTSPKTTEAGVNLSGIKAAASGFGIVVVGELWNSSGAGNISTVPSTVGSIVMIVGIGYHVVSLFRRRRS